MLCDCCEFVSKAFVLYLVGVKPAGWAKAREPLIAITRRLDWQGKGSRMDLSVAGQMGAGPRAGPSDGAPENSATA